MKTVFLRLILLLTTLLQPAIAATAELEDAASSYRLLLNGERDGRTAFPEALAVPVAWGFSGGDVCKKAQERAADGDIVFLERNSGFFGAVAKASNSWTGHVGIALKDARGQWRVFESTAPQGRSTPLCDFLSGSNGRAALGRLRGGLGESKLGALKRWVENPANFRKPYDYKFDIRARNSLFCSKFVYLAYNSVGIQVGRVQTLRQIYDEYRGWGKEALFKMIEGHFKQQGFSTFPWTLETVTPGSQLADPKLSITNL